jgi:cytochrome c5
LVGIAVLLYVLARIISSNTQEKNVLIDPAYQATVAERIAPVAKVAIAGKDNSALAPAPTQAAAPATELGGEEVFNMACLACHGAGVAGAPKMGDKAAWGPRIAKGAETLHKHAIEGFQGSAGFMPPKGGRADLADKSIVNAVDYMIAQSK